MKINYKKAKTEEIYKPGNVLRGEDGVLYLVVNTIDCGYALVCLTRNIVLCYKTLEELARGFKFKSNAVVNAEMNVFE